MSTKKKAIKVKIDNCKYCLIYKLNGNKKRVISYK